jgi:hypothetical protein
VNAVIAIGRELYGLFVEDGAFAIAILVWLGLFAAIAHLVDPPVRAPLLFLGFAIVLIVGVRRASA